ncbi:trehalase [Marasmius fiardii PR-910]|nr:trehalase [Marasmius fiardii PR-910]
MLTVIATTAWLLNAVYAQSSSSAASGSASQTQTTVGGTSSASISQITVSTVVASASAASTATLPSQVPLPPPQPWCPGEIFCPGRLLQEVNLANLYVDPKTFVDKPTVGTERQVLDALNALGQNPTVGQYQNFVNTNFKGEGLELEAVVLSDFETDPPFLNNVTDPVVKAFSKTVHGFWNDLIRTTNRSTLCDGTTCESTLIPLNHTFVVPGGRFREQYYWDSFWIVEGLLESRLFSIVNDTLQNFMDELDTIGFIPNGGRKYYLDRSQPPLFTQMLSRYVTVTNDRNILTRALPLAEKEFQWWQTNRTLNVTSPFTNRSHAMTRYAVVNSAPRPESYLTDYLTVNGPGKSLNETQRADVYAELASGAESGWDYSSRWLTNITLHTADLTTLNLRSIIPVDLNSILYNNHILLANLYGSSDSAAADRHRTAAASLREGILDLFWDSNKTAFYDFNLKTNSRNSVFTTATFYPFWSGIIPDDVLASQEKAFAAFSSINLVMNRYNGTYPTTFVDTGLQWDAPNTWPPHQYIALQALRALPSNITSNALPNPAGQSSFNLVPAGQLGLDESQLPGQPITTNANATATGTGTDINRLNGTVFNGGNATQGEGWGQQLQRELANRYIASALCSWHATGGEIPGVLPRLSDAELNVTQSVNQRGNMFEKFSNLDIDSAGRGGEYTVQAGFGWTNGVVLWVSSVYGNVLVQPQCPDLLHSASAGGGGGNGNGTTGSGGSGNGAVGVGVKSSMSLMIMIGMMTLVATIAI